MLVVGARIETRQMLGPALHHVCLIRIFFAFLSFFCHPVLLARHCLTGLQTLSPTLAIEGSFTTVALSPHLSLRQLALVQILDLL